MNVTEKDAQASNDGQVMATEDWRRLADSSNELLSKSAHVIECFSDSPPTYFSAKVGLDFASPAGGWTMDRSAATVVDTKEAKELLDGPLAHMAPFCQVVAK